MKSRKIYVIMLTDRKSNVKNLLSIFEGDLPVYFYHEETKEYEFLGKDNLIWINDPLKKELTAILGKDNVVVQN